MHVCVCVCARVGVARVSVCVCVCVLYLCLVTQLWPTLCNPMDCIAHQTPLSMGLPRQEYWGGWVAIFLHQGIFLIQELNPCLLCLLHCKSTYIYIYLHTHTHKIHRYTVVWVYIINDINSKLRGCFCFKEHYSIITLFTIINNYLVILRNNPSPSTAETLTENWTLAWLPESCSHGEAHIKRTF